MKEVYKDEIKCRLVSFISKKFIIAIVVLLGSLFMLHTGRISGQEWTIIVSADTVVYSATNAFSKKYKDYSGDKK